MHCWGSLKAIWPETENLLAKMNITIKSLRINRRLSEETFCFTASLCIDGKKVADVSNRGCGGANEVLFTSRETEKKVLDYIAAMPPHVCELGELPMDLDFYVSLRVGEENQRKETDKIYNRISKKAVIYRLQGESYEAGQALYTDHKGQAARCAAFLKGKYGDKVTFITSAEQLGKVSSDD